MHRFAPVALATILAASAPARAQAQNGSQPRAQAQAPTPFTVPPATGHFTDPANLAGERPNPRTGRELPIDGGLGANNQPNNALGLAQILRKLNTRASLMLIVAHPDDEDGGMLAYYSRGLGVRTAVLTLTRGEGGQNQMTGDFEDALGLIRTQELLSADRYMGVDTQMFGTEVDFGFSKTKAEAFQKWNHERVLYDAVRAVRIFRPLVIAAVFSGAVTDGHGQHQVSGQIAQEVFKAAGDPNVFPELTREGILPWQPLKVYARVPFSRVTPQGLYDYATGQTVPAEFTNYVTGQKFTTEPTADVTINEGATDPLLSTCAANPADLPASLRSSNTPSPDTPSPQPTTTQSSRPDSTNTLSSRPEASRSEAAAERPAFRTTTGAAGLPRNLSSRAERSVAERPASQPANACTPLSYVQFARIGLGLQRTQIGTTDRISRPGRVDVGYHLYGSRVCAPGLPNPTPNLCEPKSAENLSPPQKPSARPHDFSRHPERSPLGVNEGPPYFAGTTTTLSSRPEASQREAVAERPLYFAGTTTTLSSRSEARSAVAERPLYFAGTTTTLSSRPEASQREAVAERPAFLLVDAPNSNSSTKAPTAFAAKAPTARSITAQGNALGSDANNKSSAEGAPYTAALANQPNFTPTTTTLSSRPEASQREAVAERPLYFAGTTTTLSSRPEARSAAAERPLYFAGTTTTLSSRPEASQREAVAERPLYFAGTTTTLSSRPEASRREAVAERPLYFAGTTTTLSSRPEASQREAVAERPAFLRVDALNSNSSTKARTASAAKAPTARSITAQGNALGSDPNKNPSAEGAPYNPTLANQPNFTRTTTTLSSRPEARSAVAERPLYFAGTTTTLSSRPEARREAVAERPLYFAGTATTLSSRPEASQREAAAERPAFLRVDALNSNPSTKAPTARSITAQGNANESDNDPTAEGAPYNPALANQPSFFDGIDISWAGIESLDVSAFRPADTLFSLERHIQYATAHFDPAHPDAIAPELAGALDDVNHEIQRIAALPNPTPARADLLHELKIKRGQLDQALTLSLGLSLDATTTQPDLAQGETAPVTLSLTSTSPDPLAVTFIGVNGDGDFQPPQAAPQLSPGGPFLRTRPVSVPPYASSLITKPYFYRNNIEQPVYNISNPRLRNAPQTPPPFTAAATVTYQGTSIRIDRIVHSGPQPVSIIPPVSLSFDSHANVVPESQKLFRTAVHVQNLRNSVLNGKVSLGPPTGWSPKPTELSLANVPPLAPFSSLIDLQPLPPIYGTGGPESPWLSASVRIAGDNRDIFADGFRPVGYGTLPRTNYYTPATLRVVPVDLKLPPPDKRRIAYLPGTGDDVPAALASIGLAPTILKVSDLTAANLAHFDTVVLGVRTYNAHPDLHGAPTQALLDFARNGGNVVVQYQTPEFTAADAPYPLTTHNERVVDETTPVKILDPNSPLLTTPNRITPADFNNWIEERGHGFLDTWDPHYTALTETHDPGAPAEHIEPQAPQRGGLITVQLGRGRWTYCAFALYRQLPEAVPGAFRLFVNLLTP